MPLTPPSFKGQLYTVISRQAAVGVKLFLYASWFLAQAWSQSSDLQTLVLGSWLGKPSAHMCAELGMWSQSRQAVYEGAEMQALDSNVV